MTGTERSTGRGRFIPSIFILGGIIIINLLFWLTISIFPVIKSQPRYLRELWLLVEVCCVPVAVVAWNRRHEIRALRLDLEMRTSLIEVSVYALFFLSLCAFLGIDTVPPKAYVFFFGLMFIALPLFQLSGKLALKSYRRHGYNYTRVAVIGTGPAAQRLTANMSRDPGFGYRILGYFDDNRDETFKPDMTLPLDELEDFVRDKEIRQIYFTLSGHHEALARVIKIADDNCADFYYVPQIPRTMTRSFELHNIGSLPVLSIRHNPLKNVVNRCIKRTFDIVVSSVFLCFYPLIYIPIAIAIKLGSEGPVYFKQERTGYLGRPFKCLKFRTMRVNAVSDTCQATVHDPRKTKFGDFLRRTSLDELPQFINVWKGDMSIVGPRPHMLKHTEDYTRLVDRYMVRHAVKPGITGWAQVNGYRGITDELWKMERRVEHDVWYIENWTFLLDLKIMVRTVINAIIGEKNAF